MFNMITLSKSGSSVTFTFDENSGYLQNGTIEVPVNSLSLVIDDSDMATFRKSASNDIFVSARYEDFGMSKAELESWYKDNMVGSTGGGGGVDSGTVQTMIDESISGKADTTAVTEAISEAVSGKADISDIPDVSNYFDGAEYDSGTTRINFYHGNTIKAYIDASAFIVDGMIDDVRIETISGVTYLVIDFNTASGKEDIQIPLTDIFDPSNYYTKQEVDASLSGKADTTAVTASINAAVSGKVDVSVYTAYTAATDERIAEDEEVTAAGINAINDAFTAYTAATDARFAEDELASGEAFNDLNNRVNELSGKSIKAGRGISITTIETGDIVSFSLPISAGTGTYSIAEGNYTTANGYCSHAEGFNVTASGTQSHAEGGGTTASGSYSHAEGNNTKASGTYSHAEGDGTTASGYYSHAEGNHTSASGTSSHAEGNNTTANNQSEHASGQYNVSNKATNVFGNSGNTLFSVGNGTSTSARHNAFEIRQNGDIYITSGGTDIKLQDNLGCGVSESVFSAYTAATDSRMAEDEEVTAAGINAVNDKFDGLKLKKLTQSEYNALSPNYDASTLYVIVN